MADSGAGRRRPKQNGGGLFRVAVQQEEDDSTRSGKAVEDACTAAEMESGSAEGERLAARLGWVRRAMFYPEPKLIKTRRVFFL